MRRLAWPLTVPPMLAGVVAAHALAFRLTVPASERSRALAETGHAWFRYLPFMLGAGAAVLFVALARRVAAQQSTPVAWPFALLPPLALLLQEQIERGHVAFDTTIAAAVLLAVPLGLIAYVALRALLRIADAFTAVVESRTWPAPPGEGFPPTLLLAPSLVMATSAPRGPPSGAPR